MYMTGEGHLIKASSIVNVGDKISVSRGRTNAFIVHRQPSDS